MPTGTVVAAGRAVLIPVPAPHRALEREQRQEGEREERKNGKNPTRAADVADDLDAFPACWSPRPGPRCRRRSPRRRGAGSPGSPRRFGTRVASRTSLPDGSLRSLGSARSASVRSREPSAEGSRRLRRCSRRTRRAAPDQAWDRERLYDRGDDRGPGALGQDAPAPGSRSRRSRRATSAGSRNGTRIRRGSRSTSTPS